MSINLEDSNSVWVFGYGSLIWKVDFPFKSQKPGYITGWVRRFWQGSTDHRGTPEEPGRVVTLISYDEWNEKFKDQDPQADSTKGICWGMVYEISAQDKKKVFEHLDYREKDGYVMEIIPVQTLDDQTIHACLYIAHGHNESFLGPGEGIESLAKHIATSEGPSGLNHEYLFNLCNALRNVMGSKFDDQHLIQLEILVKKYLDQS
ncbi:ChaC-like protein [Globomyces pollinis-pini]|nr:ChaC-like protein [Globomyces pollinis-pini]